MSHAHIWRKIILGRGNSESKDLSAGGLESILKIDLIGFADSLDVAYRRVKS